jgi:hypothetical protein
MKQIFFREKKTEILIAKYFALSVVKSKIFRTLSSFAKPPALKTAIMPKTIAKLIQEQDYLVDLRELEGVEFCRCRYQANLDKGFPFDHCYCFGISPTSVCELKFEGVEGISLRFQHIHENDQCPCVGKKFVVRSPELFGMEPGAAAESLFNLLSCFQGSIFRDLEKKQFVEDSDYHGFYPSQLKDGEFVEVELETFINFFEESEQDDMRLPKSWKRELDEFTSRTDKFKLTPDTLEMFNLQHLEDTYGVADGEDEEVVSGNQFVLEDEEVVMFVDLGSEFQDSASNAISDDRDYEDVVTKQGLIHTVQWIESGNPTEFDAKSGELSQALDITPGSSRRSSMQVPMVRSFPTNFPGIVTPSSATPLSTTPGFTSPNFMSPQLNSRKHLVHSPILGGYRRNCDIDEINARWEADQAEFDVHE